MKASAIVYTSATGFTARYAALLGEKTGLRVYPLDRAVKELDRDAGVLYLGWLCAGSIKGLSQAARRFEVKAVCAVGMAPPDPAYVAKLQRPEKLWQAPLFYLRGGYRPEGLRGIYRPMMAVMAKAVAKAPAGTPEEKAMQAAFRQGGDWVNEQALHPVLNWLEA